MPSTGTQKQTAKLDTKRRSFMTVKAYEHAPIVTKIGLSYIHRENISVLNIIFCDTPPHKHM